jgi:sugar lactone lactonase YvrE
MIGWGALYLITVACEPATPPAAPPSAPPPPPTSVAPATPPAETPPKATTAEPIKPQIPEAIVIKDAAFKTPESVLYDAETDEYLVSNINGKPTEADDNGTIVKVSPEGKVLGVFIDGAKPDIKLSAPKGMAIVGDTLFVSDLDVIRKFDKKTGKTKGEIKAPKATFLNDISANAAGKIFVSDSGLKLGKDGLEPNGSDAVFTFDAKANAIKAVRANADLLGPNGVLADGDGTWVVTFRGNELYFLNKKGEREHVTKLPKGGLDGMVKLNDGTLLISSWEGQAIYRGRPGGTFEPVLTGLTSPADIGLDTKRNRVLIPSFTTDTVFLQPLPELAPIAEPSPPPAAATPATAAPAKDNAKPAAPTAATPAAAPAKDNAKPAAPAAAPAKPAAPAAATPAAAPAKDNAKPAAPAAAPAKPAAPAAATPAAAPAKK